MPKIFDTLLVIYFYFYLSLFFTDYSFLSTTLSISNINGPTIGLLFLLLIRYITGKKSFFKNPLVKILNIIKNLDDKKILFGFIAIIFMILTVLSITRHLSLSSGASDLGIFSQAIWNTTQGDILFSSLKNNISLLGDHFEPILLLISPLYLLWPNPITLLVLQSLLLASAIIPLYLIARGRIRERLLIFAFIISYALSKPLRGVGLSDFHPECFIVPLLFWAYYFLIKKRNLLLFLAIFFLFLCKEDTTFLISGLGFFAFFFQKRIRLGAALFVCGILLWFLETKIILPYFNPLWEETYMNRLPFGTTYLDNLRTIINNPLLLVRLLFTKEKIEYCLKLFGPLAFFSLLSPKHYILIAIPLFRNLLPTDLNFSGWYNISSHYTAGVIPFLYISAIYGCGWLIEKRRERKPTAIALIIVFTSLMFYGKTDGYKFARFLNEIKSNRTLEKISYLKLVPKDVSVSTNFNLVPHLSQRKYIFEWNPHAKTSKITQYLVIDMNLLEYLGKEETSQIGAYLKEIRNTGYEKVFSNSEQSFLIFHNPGIDKSLVTKISLGGKK